jgi:hypothetical protein
MYPQSLSKSSWITLYEIDLYMLNPLANIDGCEISAHLGDSAHGLHLNSQGKRRLMHLIAERISGGHVSSVSSIPVITHARASPFLA